MTLSPLVFLLVLIAAICHANWNALVKAGNDKLAVQVYVNSVPGVVCLLIIPFLPLPAVESWPYLLLSTAVHQVYYATLLFAYRHGDLSQVYPVARGLAPAIVAAGAWFFAGEGLRAIELLGLFTASLGIVSLSRLIPFPGHLHLRRQGEIKGLVFAGLTACMIASYSITDGLGVRAAGNAFSYITWLFVLEAFPLVAFALWIRRGAIAETFRPTLKTGLFGGMLSGAAYGIVIWAMSLAPLAHVVALRETSVIMAAAIGAYILKEPFGKSRVLSASLVALGIAVLHLSG